MKSVMGFVLGVRVATAGVSGAQSWRSGPEPLDLSVGTRDWQSFWQQQQVDEIRRAEPLDPCRH
jgi:hypothetical protein